MLSLPAGVRGCSGTRRRRRACRSGSSARRGTDGGGRFQIADLSTALNWPGSEIVVVA
jgi:hypothetical protein